MLGWLLVLHHEARLRRRERKRVTRDYRARCAYLAVVWTLFLAGLLGIVLGPFAWLIAAPVGVYAYTRLDKTCGR